MNNNLYKSALWTIVPAAGIGTRMQVDRPKQYLKIRDHTILEHVVNCFSAIARIEKVVVVLHAKDHWWSTLPLLHSEKIFTVIGGQERVHSVLLGLKFLSDFADDNDFVLVHDAARPCIQASDVLRLVDELKDHDVGGLLGLPVVDTLKKIDNNNCVEKTISREHLWHAQTPQCFRYGILKRAIETALAENKIVTDESSAIEYLGLKPKMVLGDARNIKITFAEDVALAEKLLR